MAGRDALRLFVAAYPPPQAAEAMLRELDGSPLPQHRRTPLEQLHLTLLFLGDTDPRDLPAVQESVARSAAGLGAFTLTPRRLIALPPRGRPRLLALETDAAPELLEIHRRLARRLARPGQRRREGFTPHLTLCRFGHDSPVDRAGMGRDCAGAPFRIDRVRLVRSVLLPGGAEHREVAAFDLV